MKPGVRAQICTNHVCWRMPVIPGQPHIAKLKPFWNRKEGKKNNIKVLRKCGWVFLILFHVCLFWDRVSLCRLGWPGTQTHRNRPTLPSQCWDERGVPPCNKGKKIYCVLQKERSLSILKHCILHVHKFWGGKTIPTGRAGAGVSWDRGGEAKWRTGEF